VKRFVFSKSLDVKDLSSSIETLTQKTDALIAAHDDTRLKLAAMVEERDGLKQKIEGLNEELGRVKEENKVLKMANAIKGDEEKVTESKRRISQLVREIDKCLALLNDW